jgi:hypothetical protein
MRQFKCFEIAIKQPGCNSIIRIQKFLSSQVNTLPKAKSQAKDKRAKNLQVRHTPISSVSAMLCSTDGYAAMVFAFSNLTPCFLT